MWGANCWSDHRLVWAKVLVKAPHSRPKRASVFFPFAVQQLCNADQEESYREDLAQWLQEMTYNYESFADQNWVNLKTFSVAAADHVISHTRKKHPDWFLKSTDTLTLLIEVKNNGHNWMLQTNSPTHCKEFCRQQIKVEVAVDTAKKEWTCKTVCEGEKLLRMNWTDTVE